MPQNRFTQICLWLPHPIRRLLKDQSNKAPASLSIKTHLRDLRDPARSIPMAVRTESDGTLLAREVRNAMSVDSRHSPRSKGSAMECGWRLASRMFWCETNAAKKCRPQGLNTPGDREGVDEQHRRKGNPCLQQTFREEGPFAMHTSNTSRHGYVGRVVAQAAYRRVWPQCRQRLWATTRSPTRQGRFLTNARMIAHCLRGRKAEPRVRVATGQPVQLPTSGVRRPDEVRDGGTLRKERENTQLL